MNAVGAAFETLGVQRVVASKKNHKIARLLNCNRYCDRNKVERSSSHLKQFRWLATRYENAASTFPGMVHFGSVLLWLR
jgi:transposase